MEFAVYNPALIGAVFDRMPHVAVTRNDPVAFSFQLLSCREELIPTRTNFSFDCSWVVSSEYVLSNRTTVDERAASCLVAKAFQRAVFTTDIYGILSDAGILNHLVGQAQVSVVCCITGSVALRILQNECCFCSIDVRSVFAAAGQCLVKRRLVSAIRRSDNCGFELHVRVRMRFQIFSGHVRNFIRKAPQIDGNFFTLGVCTCGRIRFRRRRIRGRLVLGVVASASCEGCRHHQQCRDPDQQVFHAFHAFHALPPLFVFYSVFCNRIHILIHLAPLHK
ncbi:hypothetical protein D3C74_240590 [compost metagenome]